MAHDSAVRPRTLIFVILSVAALAQISATAPARQTSVAWSQTTTPAQTPATPNTPRAGRALRFGGPGTKPTVTNPAAAGLFQPVELYDASEYIIFNAVAAADVNRDGKPDLAVASQNISAPNSDGAIEIRLGNGDGTFQSPMTYDSGGITPVAIAIADMNGDGKLDIVVANQGNGSSGGGVAILLGNGDGTFQTARVFASNGGASIAVADINGDGKPDVMITTCCESNGYGEVESFLGNGDGTLRTGSIFSSGGYGASSIAVADVNHDGHADVLVTNFCGTGTNCPLQQVTEGSVGVLLGDGSGAFASPVLYDAGGPATSAITVADVNGDGKPDLLVGNCGAWSCSPDGPGTIAVLLANADGTFQPAVSYNTGDSVMSMATADIDRDGKLDAITAAWGGAVIVLRGNGDGTFQPADSYSAGASYSTSLAVADLNGDKKPDAVVVNNCTFGNNIGCVGYAESSMGVFLNQVDVSQTSTSTTVSSSLPSPSDYGQAMTLTAVVASPSGTATGTVIFYDGSTQIGSALLANRIASLTVSPAVGSHMFSASYQGCEAFASSTSSAIEQVVDPAPTTTSLVSNANPTGPGGRVIYTATVTSEFGGVAHGSVTFQQDGGAFASVTLSQNQASYKTSYATPGVRSITAVYSGDSDNGGSTSPALLETIIARTKTVVATSGSPTYFGQLVTFTASVTGMPGVIPDGDTVTFAVDHVIAGTGTTTNGVATFTTSSLTGKKHSIKATYNGDPIYEPSYGTVAQLVDRYSTTTTLVSSVNPSAYGQTISFTATVIPTGPYTPTGKVSFAGLGTATLNAGKAVLTKTWLNAGTHTTSAVYKGDEASSPSTSASLNQVVNPVPTTTTVASSSNPSSQGESVTFTATVKSSTGANTVGTVTFTAGNTTLGTVTLNGTVASISTATLPVGSTIVTATYNGVTDFAGSAASLTQVVAQ